MEGAIESVAVRIYAFQGYRYAPEVADLGALAAPPFDQIDAGLRDELQARSPYHYSHFTCPVEDDGVSAYESAALVHASWLQEGIVVREEAPCLYPYLVESADGSRRGSLCCLVAAGTTTSSDLRPHELTVEKPLADRLALLRATRIDPEPVMILAEDDGSLEERLRRDLVGLAPLVTHADAQGNRHHLYRLDDPDAIDGYKQLLADRSATIADGHHRCKTAQLFAEEAGAQEGSPAAAKLAVLISLASHELRIDPVHRLLEQSLDAASIQHLALSRRPFAGVSGAELAADVAAAKQPALGVWLQGRPPEIWRLDSSQAPATTPRKAHELSTVLLHYMVLQAAGLDMSSAGDGRVAYRSDPDQLYAMLAGGAVGAGFWLPPMKPAAFAEAVSEGDLLPPKSTRFMPKLISGMVWVGHDAQVR